MSEKCRRGCSARRCGRRTCRWLREMETGRVEVAMQLGYETEGCGGKEMGGDRGSGRGRRESWCCFAPDVEGHSPIQYHFSTASMSTLDLFCSFSAYSVYVRCAQMHMQEYGSSVLWNGQMTGTRVLNPRTTKYTAMWLHETRF